MVLEYDCFAISEMRGNTLAFLPVKNNTSKLWIYGVVLVKS